VTGPAGNTGRTGQSIPTTRVYLTRDGDSNDSRLWLCLESRGLVMRLCGVAASPTYKDWELDLSSNAILGLLRSSKGVSNVKQEKGTA